MAHLEVIYRSQRLPEGQLHRCIAERRDRNTSFDRDNGRTDPLRRKRPNREGADEDALISVGATVMNPW